MFALQQDSKIAIIEPTTAAKSIAAVSSSSSSDITFDMPKTDLELPVNVVPKISNKFKNSIPTVLFDGGETNLSTLEDMLEIEKQNNKLAAWNKLDKMSRIQKLHAFAEKYGREHGLPVKEIRNLKMFFTTSLDKGRLNRAKDVVYDRETREVKSIPALHFNNESKSFTLRNLEDAKRTLKSDVFAGSTH